MSARRVTTLASLVRLKPDTTTVASKPDTTVASKPDTTTVWSKPGATTVGLIALASLRKAARA